MYSVTYNGKGRANQINSSSFAYDANDYRINKNSDRYYLEGEHIEATYSSSDQLQNKYFRGVIVDEIVNGFTYHSSNANDWSNYTYHHDHLNSVTHLTGHNGSSEESTGFDAFGAPLNLSVPGTGNDLLYTGREYDRDTSLYYYRARYYDPEIGRFISEDPLGFEAGINFYAYVNNNPVNLNDPEGKVLNFAIGAGVNVIVGGAIRGLTGGNIFDGNAIAADAAIGAATSGLGAFAQLRHANRVVDAARDLGKVVGNPQSTGTFLHAAASQQQAAKFIQQGADKVFFDRGLNAVTGLKGAFKPNVRPDVSATFGGNRVRITEVVSKTQTTAQLTSKNLSAVGQLQSQGFNASQNVIGKISTGRLPLKVGGQRTVGAVNLPVNGIGGSFIAGGNAITATSNYNSGSGAPTAGGGFVLYPSRPNTNMLQSVYVK